MKFEKFGFHPAVTAGVKENGYESPTPIQAEAIPQVMAGRDVMGLAQTGTGKTAAFGLPILQRLMEGRRGQVRALIVAPTRELAEQIHESISSLGRETRLKSITVYGGVGVSPQVEKLRKGVEIVVACPGRLLDHINQKTIDLSQVEVLVLDEADQMFDMGFLPDIRRILKQLPAKRQTLLFSATMPDEIRRLAHEVLKDPVTVKVGATAPPVTVSHALYPVEQHLKTALLLELLHHTDTESVLVFTRTKHRAKRLGEQLEKAGYRAASLQGNLSQNRRQAALDGFRDGTFQILVATDIAARGIDVSQISHVVNYDIPDTPEAYIHVRAIERTLNASVERRTVPDFDYNIAAPKKDSEFARPPRQPQVRKPAGAKKSVAHAAAAAPSGQGRPKPAGGTPRKSGPPRSRSQQGGRG